MAAPAENPAATQSEAFVGAAAIEAWLSANGARQERCGDAATRNCARQEHCGDAAARNCARQERCGDAAARNCARQEHCGDAAARNCARQEHCGDAAARNCARQEHCTRGDAAARSGSSVQAATGSSKSARRKRVQRQRKRDAAQTSENEGLVNAMEDVRVAQTDEIVAMEALAAAGSLAATLHAYATLAPCRVERIVFRMRSRKRRSVQR